MRLTVPNIRPRPRLRIRVNAKGLILGLRPWAGSR